MIYLPTLLVLGLLGAWLYLLGLRGRFHKLEQRLPSAAEPKQWPTVAVIVPARNEATCIAGTVQRLAAQDYRGHVRIVVVNDHSEDDTAELAAEAGGAHTVVVDADPCPDGWTGKVWAMQQGLQHLSDVNAQPDYVLFTDADIHHPDYSLAQLVAFAEAEGRDLVSLMVKLRVERFWERLLIPAFVFFFAKLYPFNWVNDPQKTTAAAAGGCMLVRRRVLDDADLMASIKGELIDDCALASRIKQAGSGRIWLGLTETVESVRPYGGLGGVWQMVTRTAFTQLQHSPLLLMGSVLGMLMFYVLPVLMLAVKPLTGLALMGMMVTCFLPALKLYRQPLMLAPLLPVAGLLYTGMTIDSALRHWRGKGGGWKGRYQAGRNS